MIADVSRPGYVYTEDALHVAYAGLSAAASDAFSNAIVAYAVKCNPLPEIVSTLAGLGAWLEVAWAREAELARNAGVPGERILWGGSYRSEAVYQQATELGATVTFESLAQIRICEGEVRPCLRIRTDAKSRFGLPEELVPRAAALFAGRGLRDVMVQVHQSGGGWPPSPSAWARRATIAADAADVLSGHGVEVSVVSLGGGLPEPSKGMPTQNDYWAIAIPYLLAASGVLGRRLPAATVLLEPGRFLVQHCGSFVVRIIDVRAEETPPKLVLEAGICSLASMSSTAGAARVIRQRPGVPREWELLGPSNREEDRLGHVVATEPRIGDWVDFQHVGAYQQTFAVTFAEDPPETMWIPSADRARAAVARHNWRRGA